MMQITDEEFKNFLRMENEPPWLTRYRVNSFNKTSQSEMPSFRHGLNITIKPEEENFQFQIPKNKTQTKIKTKFNKEQAKILIGNELTEEIESQFPNAKEFFTELWTSDEDEDKLSNFNEAFINKFIIIKIPENQILKEPIQISYDAKNSIDIFSMLVISGKNSKSKIILNRSCEKSYISENVKIILERDSKLDFITSQNFDNKTISFQKRKAVCKENSEINWTDVCLGSHYSKSSITSLLKGQGSKTNNIVLYLATGKQRLDIYTASIHENQNTHSDITTKGVINEHAKALSRGLVKIQANASNSNGYEKQDTLLLSETAEADAIPNLEIHNHDVKCSHGSTVGQIDKEKLFYIMSRGLNQTQAKQKIVEGYFYQILKTINNKNLNKRIYEYILNNIK